MNANLKVGNNSKKIGTLNNNSRLIAKAVMMCQGKSLKNNLVLGFLIESIQKEESRIASFLF